MNLSHHVLWLAFFSVLITSCSGGGSGGGKNATPQSPEAALGALPDANRQAFEAWKTNLVKACDGSSAFGISGDAPAEGPGIDPLVLLSSNHQSLIVSSSSGEFAVFGDPHSFLGTAQTASDLTVDFNGNSYAIHAKTIRDGDICQVFLSDQKVYETHVLQSIDVVAYGGKQLSLNATTDRLTAGNHPGTSAVDVGVRPLVSSFISALTPTADAISFLASALKVSAADASKVFQLGSPDHSVSLRLANPSSPFWFASDDPTAVADSSFWNGIFNDSVQTLVVEGRIAPWSLVIDKQSNSADLGALAFRGVWSVKGKIGGNVDWTPGEVTFSGVAPFDDNAAIQCLQTRTALLKAVANTRVDNVLSPSVNSALSACNPLSSHLFDAAYNTNTLGSLATQMLTGLTPAPNVDYEGWDDVIARYSMQFLKSGTDIVSALDPKGQTAIVKPLSQYLLYLNSEVKKGTLSNDFSDRLYRMGITWAFSGQSVAEVKIDSIVGVVLNTAAPFEVSTRELIGALATGANSQDDALSFAAGIDQNYKDTSTKSLAIAMALGDSDFKTGVFDLVLQKKPTQDEMNSWLSRLNTTQTVIAKYNGLGVQQGTLVGLALKWLGDGESDAGGLDKIFSAVNHVETAFPDSTATLVQSLGSSLTKAQADLNFSSSVDQNYITQAQNTKTLAGAVGLDDWANNLYSTIIQAKPTIANFQGWQTTLTAANGFTQREAARATGPLDSSNDSYRKELIRTGIQEGWGDSDFKGVETIAVLGAFQSACNVYKGASSIANCVGLDRFSRAAKKLFDPAFGGRYAPLAQDFAGYLGQLVPESNYFSLRNNLISSYFDFQPIWSSCSNSDFSAKAQSLKGQVSQLIALSDSFQQFQLTQAISTTLQDCTP